jgi:chemotaxis family two-component system sensor kinase Cph1
MAKIKFLKGAKAGEESPLPEQGVIIGRGVSCDIQILDTMISEEHVNLSAVVAEVLDGLQLRLDETGSRVEICELPTVPGNATRLFQLFQNLLSNAIKFHSDERPPVVKIEIKEEPDCWRFFVIDNGIGMDPKFSDRIFMLFQRLHARTEYEGTGIGLAVCKKIVATHGGEIGVECEGDIGTTFWFTLPKLADSIDEIEPAADRTRTASERISDQSPKSRYL